MKTTSIYIRTADNGQPVRLTSMDIKILLLKAPGGPISITELAARIGRSRFAVSQTINGSLKFPEVARKITVFLQEIAAVITQQKTERLKAS
jgi:hypothetical protein